MKFWLLFTFLVFSTQSYSQVIIKEHLHTKIKDFKTTTISITDVMVQNVGVLNMRLNIKHNNWSDLIVTLVSPKNKVFTLVNRDRKGSGKLRIKLNEGNAPFADLQGTDGKGDWKILIEDKRKRSEGSVTYLYFMVDHKSSTGSNDDRPNNPPTNGGGSYDDVPLPPETGDMSDAQCRSKWNHFLSNNNLDPKYERIKYLCDGALKRQLRNIIKAQHRTTGYRQARQYMFSKLDNVNGQVCGVYTQECIRTRGIPNNTKMNCEHTWPKSKGAGSAPAKFDLHHLFPTKSDINSTRSSFPFCEIKSTKSGRGGSSLGKGRGGKLCFEPRADHRGDVARAMFYFSIRYEKVIDKNQEFYFKKWMKDDLVSRNEEIRNIGIEKFQGNSNPFIEIPELVNFISNF